MKKLGNNQIEEFFAANDYADGTRVAYMRALTRFVEDVHPGKDGWEGRALKWRDKLAMGQCARSLHVTAARKFLDYCVAEGYVQRNPMKTVKVKLPRGHHHETLTKVEVRRLLDHLKSEVKDGEGTNLLRAVRDEAIVLVMLYTGLRASSIVKMDLQDFDRGSAPVQAKYWCKGHREKDEFVVIPSAADKAIDAYVKHSGRKWSSKGPLFLACGRRRMSYSGLYVALMNRFAEAKVTRKGVCVHSLRHTAAINAYMSKRDIVAVQKMLAHRSLSTTEQYLGGFDRVKEAAELGIKYD